MSLEKDCNKRRDKQWCEWRKAKKQKQLTSHRRRLKREANQKEFEMER